MKKIILFAFVFTSVISYGQKIDSINCSKINKEVDEFTDKITYRVYITPSSNQTFIKSVQDGITNYYLSIYIPETDINRGTGVIILLKNGIKINKPDAEVDYALIGDQFYAKTFIKLTNNDIELLKQSGIAKYKLYVSTGDITEYSDLCKDLFNCLIQSK